MIYRKTLLLLLTAFMILDAEAQLCQGSLGDPIVNITFGSGPNPGGPLSAATTSYQHMSSDCPNDGQYAVRNRTDNCYASWHTLSTDHTGDPSGYFMLVNASFQPSAFYVDTVDLFCSNTTYEFAAWAINMVRTTTCGGGATILPNLTFNIERTDGTILQTYNTGNMPVTASATWNQYGFFFTAPTGVNKVVLRITNNAPGGCGNDIAIDDITFRPCGPLVSASISGGGTFHQFCQDQSALLTFVASVSNSFFNPVLQWQTASSASGPWSDIAGATTNSMTKSFPVNATPGNYLFRLSVVEFENSGVPKCRVNSAPITITVHATPVVTISNNSPVCENSTANFSAAGGSAYLWSGPGNFTGSDASINLIDAQPFQSGTYSVEVTSDAGCKNNASTIVTINPRPLAQATPAEVSSCEGTPVQLNGSGGTSYSWQPSSGLSSSSVPDPVATPSDTTRYQLIVSNDFSCTDTAAVQVNVFKKPVAHAGPDLELILGQTIQLNGSASGTSIMHVWSPAIAIDDVSLLHPFVNPVENIEYILSVTSAVGCGSATDTVKVKVFKGLFVPTAFTPNDDGLNDVWKIPGLNIYRDHEVVVYNRYGQVVFTTRNNQPWDGKHNGKELPSGVYPYMIRVKNENILLKGWVLVVR